MGFEPGADRLHRDIRERHFAALDQDLADRAVGVAVLPRIADTHHVSVGQVDPPGTLNAEKKRVDRIGEPGKLEPLAGERAVRDRGTVVIGHERRAVEPAGDSVPGISRAEFSKIDADQIRRPLVDRHVIARRACPAAFDLDFEIAGELADAGAVIRDPEGHQRGLEKGPRRFRLHIRDFAHIHDLAADRVPVSGSAGIAAHRARGGFFHPASQDFRKATSAASGSSAVQPGISAKDHPLDIGRPWARASGASRSRQAPARTGREGKTIRDATEDPRIRHRVRNEVSVRWTSRPASSSDRRFRHRARRSRHP